MNIENLIVTYGYLILLAGAMIEGETFLVAAAILAQQGYLDMRWVILAAFLGAVVSAQCCFLLGRTQGIAFLKKREKWRVKTRRIFRLLRRFDHALVLFLHFLYGIRTVTPFVVGASGFSPLKFLMLNSIGVMAWAVIVGCMGYQFGYLVVTFLQEAKKYQVFFLIFFVSMAVVFWIIRRVRRRRSRISPPECPPLP